eukprot:8687422-Alexandrium_andersonii.AAC.1
MQRLASASNTGGARGAAADCHQATWKMTTARAGCQIHVARPHLLLVPACNPPPDRSAPLVRKARRLLHSKTGEVVSPPVFPPGKEDPPRVESGDC